MLGVNTMKALNENTILNQLFNEMSDLVYLTRIGRNRTFTYELANRQAMEFSGLTAESFGKLLHEVLPEKVSHVIQVKYQEVIEKGEPITYEERFEVPLGFNHHKFAAGQILYWESKITPVFNQDGDCTHLLAVVRDITDRKQKEYESKRANDRFDLVWDSVADAMYIFDENDHFTKINHSFEKLMGWTERELLLDPSISIIPKGSREDLFEIFAEVKKGRIIPSYETKRITKDGRIVDVLASYSPIYDANGRWDGGIAVYKDISEIKKYEAYLKKLALQDPLTGLPNRMALTKNIAIELERAKASNKILAVLFLDIDEFKKVNDTMGHDVGDELIQEFARRVKECIRSKDLLARLGGDEFVVLMNDLTDKQEAIEIAQRILQSLQTKWEINSYDRSISASIGITFLTDDHQDVRNLLKQADLALYQAKEKGKNNFQIYE